MTLAAIVGRRSPDSNAVTAEMGRSNGIPQNNGGDQDSDNNDEPDGVAITAVVADPARRYQAIA